MSAKSRQPKKGTAADKRPRQAAAPRKRASATAPPASVVMLCGALLSVPGALKFWAGQASFFNTVVLTGAAFVVGWLLISIVYQVVGSFIDAMPPPTPPGATPALPPTIQPIPSAYADLSDMPLGEVDGADLPRVEGLPRPADAPSTPGVEPPP